MYRKIQCRIWHDRKFLGWSVVQKMTFFYLLTGRHSHPIPGVIIGTSGEICEALKGANAIGDATADAIGGAIAGLIADGVLEASPVAPLLYLPNAIRHNAPTSPGQVRMWAKCVDDIPECDLKDRILSDLYECLSGMSSGMLDAMGGAIGDAIVDKQRTKNKPIAVKKARRKSASRGRKTEERKKREIAELALAQGVAAIVLPYLGDALGRSFDTHKADIKRFKALVHEGYTKEQMISVVDHVARTWDRSKYNITPKSLFDPEKFPDRLRSVQSRKPHTQFGLLKPVGEEQ